MLVATVLVAHLAAVDTVAWRQGPASALQSMDTPEFARTNRLNADTRAPAQDGQPFADEAPPSAMGQVVQARMVLLPKPAPPARPPATQPKPQQPPQPRPKAPAAVAVAAAADQTAPPLAQPPAPKATPTPPTTDPTGFTPLAGPLATPPVAPSPTPAPDRALVANSPTAAPPEPSLASTTTTQTTDGNRVGSAAPAGTDPATWLARWPINTRLNYQLKGYYRGDFYGSARVQWVRDAEQRYQASIDVSVALLFKLRMTSQGRINPVALVPEVYEEDVRGRKRLARFGPQTVQLDNGNTVPRPAGLQDTASQFVQLSQDFATGRTPLAVGAVVPVALGRPGGVDHWVYDVVGLDTLSTGVGEVQAFHLKPRPLTQARGQINSEMWFSPQLQHLPVRIKLNLSADTWLDLLLDHIEQAR